MDGNLPFCSTLIRGALVVDGSGGTPAKADVAILKDRIVAVGDLAGARAGTVVDGTGLALAPGFIDTHSHDDRAVLMPGGSRPKLSQGVTTVVVGNCGISLAPLDPAGDPPAPLDLLGGRDDFRFPSFGAYAQALQGAALGVNVAALVGHGTLRVGRMADWRRPADAAELRLMARDVEEAMAAGASGLSTGLAYPPNRAAGATEVATLARSASRHGGRLCMHVRNEFDAVLEATREAFLIAREAQAYLVLSHQKVAGRNNRGHSAELLRCYRDDGAGLPFAIDAYPYTAGSTVLDPAFAAQSERVLVSWSRPHPEAAGRDLAELAGAWGCTQPEAMDRLQPGGAVYFHMDETDVARILGWDRCMVGSDGLPHDVHPHPRLWGAFARILGVYVAERGLLSLAEAVRRMTSLPAAVFGLRDRGLVAPGKFADLVLFDPAAIHDRSTYEDPCREAVGVRAVFVNGVPVGEGAGGRYLSA